MGSKRNRKRKPQPGRGKRRKTKPPRARRPGTQAGHPAPSELDQIAVLIVEEQLGLPTTDLMGLEALAAKLPFEPSMAVLSMLAHRAEDAINDATKQIALAEEFFGDSPLVEGYRQLIAQHSEARIFGPQSLYTLMRILVDAGYEAPISQALTDGERVRLMRAVVASNSVVEWGVERELGPSPEDLLAYELQVGSYYSRPAWLEEMARHRELYRLAVSDSGLLASPDCEPVKEWLEGGGLSVEEQWRLGFALSAVGPAWDPSKKPHIPAQTLAELLARAGLGGREKQALAAISATRAELQAGFAQLKASGRRYAWECRPFALAPFLRVADGGLVLLGRPWIVSWLGEGFHYRAMQIAQAEDARRADGRANHVQNFTAYTGQVFERYCLGLAQRAISAPASVLGEQTYGKGQGKKTSDVAVSVGEDLSGEAALPDIDMAVVKGIWPIVVAQGHVWQTSNLWHYLDTARDAEKCGSLGDARVQPLQVMDARDYEKLLALAVHGSDLPQLLQRKVSGPYQRRDLAVWLQEDRAAPSPKARLPELEAVWREMTEHVKDVFGPD